MDDFEIFPVATRRYPPESREAMVLRCQPKTDTTLRASGGWYRFSDLYCFCTALVTRSAKATRPDFSLIQLNSRTVESCLLLSRAPAHGCFVGAHLPHCGEGFSGGQPTSVDYGESPKIYFANERVELIWGV
jgi:hypothetical protein